MSTYEDADEVIGDALALGEDNVMPKDDVLLPPPARQPVQDHGDNMPEIQLLAWFRTPERQEDDHRGARTSPLGQLGLVPRGPPQSSHLSKPLLVRRVSPPGMSVLPSISSISSTLRGSRRQEKRHDEGHGVYLSEHPGP
jgi:hypothetical protein